MYSHTTTTNPVSVVAAIIYRNNDRRGWRKGASFPFTSLGNSSSSSSSSSRRLPSWVLAASSGHLRTKTTMTMTTMTKTTTTKSLTIGATNAVETRRILCNSSQSYLGRNIIRREALPSHIRSKVSTLAGFHTSVKSLQRQASEDDHEGSASTTSNKQKKKRSSGGSFMPRKAAVQLTDRSRTFFQQLLANPPRPEVIGVQLQYETSRVAAPRMAFTFRFVTADDIGPHDEAVSLELVRDGDGDGAPMRPKSPAEAVNDGLPKLYVSADAFLKVLGATVDVDPQTVTPILYDKEGNKMDPNA